MKLGSILFTLTLSSAAFCADAPLLMIGSPSAPFTSYYNEIARAEGLKAVDYSDLSSVSAPTLNGYRVALLGSVPLTAGQVSMFTTWVQGGGKLIAIKPDKQLASLLGLSDLGATLSDGYLAIKTDSPPGAGLVSDTIQFHGTADLYTTIDAVSVATLYSTATIATSNPAVTIRSVGINGGEAVAFTYDLARSIVYTRQGNPAWSGQDRDDQAPIRSNDLFFGNALFDPRPDWVDRNKVGIPQADEQQRLLANVILHVTRDRLPLPRFWYFPFFKKAVVIMTGDDHASGATAGRFDSYAAASPAGCVVDNWECIRGSSYIFTSTPLTNAEAVAYTAQGFEIGLHVNTNCDDYTPATLSSFYSTQLSDWSSKYTGLPRPATNRTHCIAWSDYDTQPQVALTNGIRLDTNYYYWPGTWIAKTPGYFTGSGMPMRFAKADGTLIDVYQATTQMTDESEQVYPAFAASLLDNAIGSKGFYAALTANMHTDSNTGPSATMSNQIVAAAKERGVPVVSGRQMLTWLDARNGSSLTGLTWNGTSLAFTIAAAQGATGLRGMLPARFGTAGLASITQNGVSITYSIEWIKGVVYAVFPAGSGVYQATYANSAATVTISPLTASIAPGQTQQFTATVLGAANTNVIWSITPSIGTISATGLYTAPASLTADPITVTAYSVADASKSASAIVQLFVPSAPPVISSVTTSGAGTSAAINWITDVPSHSVVEYGTQPSQLTTQVSVGTLVTSHTVTLPGLTPGVRYYYRVRSTDAGSQTTLWPPLTNPPADFLGAVTVSIWPPTAQPGITHEDDTSPVELGVKFRSAVAGFVTGIRFYKGTGNNGTHVGNLWTSTGALLSRVTFINESVTGWQEASFATPVQISPNATYIISYHAPQAAYAFDVGYFAATGVTNGPLQALRNGVDGGNGVFNYSASSLFPDSTFNSSNYWVDVLFTSSVGSGDLTPPVITAVAATPGTTSATITWTTNEAADTTVRYGTVATSLTQSVTDAAMVSSHSITLTGLTPGQTYFYTVHSKDAAGNTATSPTSPATFTTTSVDTIPPVISAITVSAGATQASVTWNTNELSNSRVNYGTSPGTLTQSVAAEQLVTTHTLVLNGLVAGTTYYYAVSSADSSSNTGTSTQASFSTQSSLSLWEALPIPGNAATFDTASVELGVKFRSDVAGSVTGIRFYKNNTNTGTHIGNLWSDTGTRLATVIFTNESASGWQEAIFPTPVAISANTLYVVSYFAPVGGYAFDSTYFASTGIDNAPLHAPATGAVAGGNGVYLYGAGSAFPNQSFNATNYWVDVMFSTAGPQTWSLSGTISPAAAGSGATITLSGASTGTVTADTSGNYTFTGLANGSYTVTPTKTGVSFTPASQAVTINSANSTAVNFSAAAQTWSMSGTISPAAVGSGATITLSGASTGTVTADASGNYTFTGLANGSYTITPTKAGFSFTPVSRSVTVNSANSTGVNFTGTQTSWTISGTISPVAAGSGATVTLSGTSTGTVTANASGVYSFTGRTNGSYTVTPTKAGYSFTPVSRSVTINSANSTGVNFTGTRTWTISGTISPASLGSGATVTLSGSATRTVTANSSGVYTFTGLTNGLYIVTPSKAGVSFTPTLQLITISGANRTANFAAR
jgi:hypothetical protein